MDWQAFAKGWQQTQATMKGIRNDLINRVPNPLQRIGLKAVVAMQDAEINFMKQNFAAFIAAVATKAKAMQTKKTAVVVQAKPEQQQARQEQPQQAQADRPAHRPTMDEIKARAAALDGRPAQQPGREQAHTRG